jgi:UDP-GlcNAc3NAcA epimerase
MNKILSIIGARPQIIKSSPVSKELNKYFNEYLLHTGQHYDKNMSQIFFDVLKIPKPYINLNIGSGSHAVQTANMMIGIERACLEKKTDLILIYGDTNSTLAGAIVGAKLKIPVIHIEAGLRSYNKEMPEELNRICADHYSDILFCPSNTAVNNLKNEGITKNVFNVGDVMKDAVNQNIKLIDPAQLLNKYNIHEDFYFMTIHRQENTDNIERLQNIIEIANSAKHKVYFSIHPRTRKILYNNNIKISSNVVQLEPVDYLESLSFQKSAKIVITDSGGIQKEACFLKTPCITLRDETEWIETVSAGVNKIVTVDMNLFKEAEEYFLIHGYFSKAYRLYGDGNTSKKIADILRNIYA